MTRCEYGHFCIGRRGVGELLIQMMGKARSFLSGHKRDGKKEYIELSKEDALRAYARMINNLDVKYIETLLAEDFNFESQWVLATIESKREYLAYIKAKFKTIKKSGSKVYAEMAELETYPQGPCVIMAQENKDNLVATVLAEVEQGKIKRIDIGFIPSPNAAKRSGEYPY